MTVTDANASTAATAPAPPIPRRPEGRWRRFRRSDVWYDFATSPVTLGASAVFVVLILAAAFAPWLAPHTPFDASTVVLGDAFTPPAWSAEGMATYPLGTDAQGRDLLSTLMYGSRTSLIVGFGVVALSGIIGVLLGLACAFFGGFFDSVVMRSADVQLTFPPLLIALIIDGLSRAALPRALHDEMAIYVVIVSIAFANWVQYARVVRGAAMVELQKDYVKAARVTGASGHAIMIGHVLPNVIGPVLVISSMGLALAMINEATLSYLGVGMPITQPSLGTLIRNGNNFLFSGEWWIAAFPGALLVAMVLAINLVGDWLRRALVPELR
jgi:peptide/nickel transport system permease protein